MLKFDLGFLTTTNYQEIRQEKQNKNACITFFEINEFFFFFFFFENPEIFLVELAKGNSC